MTIKYISAVQISSLNSRLPPGCLIDISNLARSNSTRSLSPPKCSPIQVFSIVVNGNSSLLNSENENLQVSAWSSQSQHLCNLQINPVSATFEVHPGPRHQHLPPTSEVGKLQSGAKSDPKWVLRKPNYSSHLHIVCSAFMLLWHT